MALPNLWGSQISIDVAGNSGEPEVAALANGRFVVTWVEETGNGYEVRAKILNADGTVHREQFTVNSIPTRDQFSPNVTS
ncbi:MAG: hypothetical protein K0Q60_3857, partial [Microvirga sp.]|nr:hypothetical protein [Microvirga sp.]